MTTHGPVDPALPQLAVALSEAAMADTFAEALRDCRVRVQSCRVERVKYRPRRNCTLSYLLQLDGDDGAFEQRVAARLCSGGDSARRAANAAARDLLPSRAGPSSLHLAPLDMVTYWWPNDPKLDAARLFADERRFAAQVLPEIVAALGGGTLARQRMEIVQYVPEHRVCARVQLRRDCGGTLTDHTLYAKADAGRGGAVTHAVLRALEGAAARGSLLRTPASLLWQEHHGLHWQHAVAGCALLDLAPVAPPAAAAAVGEQLAALHAVATPVRRAVTRDELQRAPADVAAVLGLVDATWQPALDGLAAALSRGAAELGGDLVTLHGDLHPRNVLVDGDRVGLIDLDGARQGPAALDLGAWIADTLYRTLLDDADPEVASASLHAFIAGYAAGGGMLPRAQTLAWATAYQLVCQRAWRCVVNLKPGRFALAPRLIALADALLHGTPLACAVEVA